MVGSTINPSEFNDVASQYTAYKEKKQSIVGVAASAKFKKRNQERKQMFKKNLAASFEISNQDVPATAPPVRQ